MEALGYPRDEVVFALAHGEINHATASYNLLAMS